MGAVDAFIAYKFVKILSTPFDQTDAYKLGIIDADGKVLKKRKDLQGTNEKKAYTIFHQIGWNLKRILNKIPGTKSRFGSFAAALFLLKEETEGQYSDWNLVENYIMEYATEEGLLLTEDIPANNASSGQVAGLGDEPPVKKLKGVTGDIQRRQQVKEQYETFAGARVFDVSEEEYMKCNYGRKKHERWNKKLKMETLDRSDIKKFAHRNPTKSVIVRNEKTGEMQYLIRRR